MIKPAELFALHAKHEAIGQFGACGADDPETADKISVVYVLNDVLEAAERAWQEDAKQPDKHLQRQHSPESLYTQ
jgi:hypothetical protein